MPDKKEITIQITIVDLTVEITPTTVSIADGSELSHEEWKSLTDDIEKAMATVKQMSGVL